MRIKVMDIGRVQYINAKGTVIFPPEDGKLECDVKTGDKFLLGEREIRLWAVDAWGRVDFEGAKAGEQVALFFPVKIESTTETALMKETDETA